ncbi:SDR family NAD(P)-dependent oxidoreductase, partial [Streptomyces polygonati]
DLTTPQYWVNHLREAVRFHDGIRALADAGVTAFLELGPDAVLTAFVRDSLEDREGFEPVLAAAQRRERPQALTFVSALAEMYTHGVPLDWSAALPGAAGTRTDLPTYPFQRQRYWMEAPSAPSTDRIHDDAVERGFWDAVEREDLEALATALGTERAEAIGEALPALSSWRRDQRSRQTVESWRYKAVWRPVGEPATATLSGDWLVVVPSGEAARPLAEAVTDALGAQGARPVLLTVDPAGLDRAALAERIAAATAAAPPAGVLSLLALDASDPAYGTAAVSTLLLIQALADASSPARLWLVTRSAVSTGPSDRLEHPDQAQVWALGRAAALEYPQLWGGVIDLPADPDARSATRLASLLGTAGDEDQLAVRSSGVHARRLVRSAAGRPTGGKNWTPRGTVLVTGGLTEMGSRVARWLAESGAERLLLAVEPDAGGAEPTGPTAELAAELTAALSESAARVTFVPCDLTDRDDVARLLAAVPADVPLTSVVHLTGEPQVAPLTELTPDRYAAAFAAKAAGAEHLDALVDHDALDAFVLFSSVAGVWGGSGQGAYGAANAYLDALAEHRRGRGRPATSLAWGLWAQGGEDTRTPAERERREQLRRLGLAEMDPEAAIAALVGALDHDDTALVLADVDWARFAPAFTAVRPSPLLSELPEAATASAEDPSDVPEGGSDAARTLVRSLASLPAADQERRLLELVRGEIATVLQHPDTESVQARRALKELGFDSLAAVTLRGRLGAATGLRLPATLVFDHPTPADLAAYLRTALAPETPAASLDAELDRLHVTLTSAAADPDARELAAGRLRAFLSELTAAESAAGASSRTDTAQQLDEATDDDIFDFIDKELGGL